MSKPPTNLQFHTLLYAHPLPPTAGNIYARLLLPVRLYAPRITTGTHRYTRRLQSIHTHLPQQRSARAEQHGECESMGSEGRDSERCAGAIWLRMIIKILHCIIRYLHRRVCPKYVREREKQTAHAVECMWRASPGRTLRRPSQCVLGSPPVPLLCCFRSILQRSGR